MGDLRQTGKYSSDPRPQCLCVDTFRPDINIIISYWQLRDRIMLEENDLACHYFLS